MFVCFAGRGGGVWAAASAAWRAQLVRRLQGASGGAGLRGAAAIVEVRSRTLEPVDAAAYDALLRVASEFSSKSLNPYFGPRAPPALSARAQLEWNAGDERRGGMGALRKPDFPKSWL